MRIALACLCLFAAAGCGGGQQGVSDQPAACGVEAGDIGHFVLVPGGVLQKGRDAVSAEERSEAMLRIDDFLIQVHEVTNDQFSEFVSATGYVTDD